MSKHDRIKTGGTGFMDMWFGRPKSKTKQYLPSNNGGRPISQESDSIVDIQEINNEIHKLSSDEVNEKFMDILEDMNIPKDKRQPLLLKSLDEKRDMLFMHFKGKTKIVLFIRFYSHFFFICVLCT